MKTTKVPTLAEIKDHNLSCLKENKLPTEKDALQFFTLTRNWLNEAPVSHARRQISTTIFETFKRRCVAKDGVGRRNEIAGVFNAVIKAWEEHKHAILGNSDKIKKSSHSAPFSSISSGITFLNH